MDSGGKNGLSKTRERPVLSVLASRLRPIVRSVVWTGQWSHPTPRFSGICHSAARRADRMILSG